MNGIDELIQNNINLIERKRLHYETNEKKLKERNEKEIKKLKLKTDILESRKYMMENDPELWKQIQYHEMIEKCKKNLISILSEPINTTLYLYPVQEPFQTPEECLAFLKEYEECDWFNAKIIRLVQPVSECLHCLIEFKDEWCDLKKGGVLLQSTLPDEEEDDDEE